MSLWDWAVETYARPGVEAACLALQDRHGENVPFLLWAMWANPDEASLREGLAVARRWSEEVVSPLRSVRRALKAYAQEDLRAEVKAAELKAERALLEALEPLTAPRKGDPMAAVQAASTAWGAGAASPGKALQRLADAVSAKLASP